MIDERITDIPIPDECKNCIFSAFKQFQPRWIPVGERLPKVGKFVLVTDMYLDEATIARFLDDGGWEDQHGNWSSFECVSAWMPLPTAYERSEE